jgi:hypothetical protein
MRLKDRYLVYIRVSNLLLYNYSKIVWNRLLDFKCNLKLFVLVLVSEYTVFLSFLAVQRFIQDFWSQ